MLDIAVHIKFLGRNISDMPTAAIGPKPVFQRIKKHANSIMRVGISVKIFSCTPTAAHKKVTHQLIPKLVLQWRGNF